MTPMPTDSPLPSLLLLGALNSLTNQSLRLVEGANEPLTAADGLVVRLHVESPQLVVYALLHADGIEFLQHYEGRIDIRLRASLGALIQYLLLPGPEHLDAIRLQGQDADLRALQELLDFCSFWAVARGWLDQYGRLQELLGLLSREDPAWLAQLEGLPQEFSTLSQELAKQRLLQEDILNELTQLKAQMRLLRRLDMTCIVAGLGLLFGALASISGNLPVYLSHQGLLLGASGAALLLSRLWSPA